MPQNDLEVWVRVEYSGEDQAQEVAAGIDFEPPPRTSQIVVVREVRFHGVGMRASWMKVDRHSKSLGPFEDDPVFLVIEETSPRMPVDHRAFEAQFAYGTLQLVGRSVRRSRWQRGKPGKAVRMPFHRLI